MKYFNFIVFIFFFLVKASYASKKEWIDLDKVSEEVRQNVFQTEIFTDPSRFEPLYQAAFDLKTILELADIKYMCTFGATLGIFRFGELNSWDDDIDYALNVEDEEKLKKLIPLAKKIGYSLFSDDLVGWKFYREKPIINSKGNKEDLFIDLFLYRIENDKYFLEREKGRNFFKKSWMTKQEFEIRTILPLGPIKVSCSMYLKDFLKRMYGEECQSIGRYYFSHIDNEMAKNHYVWSIKSTDNYPSYKNVKIDLKNSLDNLYFTERLLSCSATLERIPLMAYILNEEDKQGVINGKYFEDGKEKGEGWISHKKNLIFNDSIDGLKTRCSFFYPIENPKELACVVGIDFFKNELSLFYFCKTNYQGKGFTFEAIKAFLKNQIINLETWDTLKLSIHPSNTSSIKIAEKIGAEKKFDGFNYTKTQPRSFYEVSKDKLVETSKNW